MAESYEINLEIQGGEQPALVMETEEGATDGASARNAEAWANGTRNGVPVTEGDPAYHNNSKYYRDSAAAIVAGDIIDDDAGIGDYNLTWSADKLAKKDEGKAPVINVSDQASAAVKTLTDGSDGMPMGVTVGIEPVQAGSGDPSPTNIRPITGRTGCNIRITNKNLNYFAGQLRTGNTSYYFVFNDGIDYAWYEWIPPQTTAYIRIELEHDKTVSWRPYYRKSDGSDTPVGSYGTSKTREFTIANNTDNYIKTRLWTYANSGNFADVTVKTMMTFDGYESYVPYNGHLYSITFPETPGTVYGGSLTVNKDGTGKLVVDRKGKGFSELTWSYDSTNTRFYSDAISGMKRINSARRVGFLCSHFQTISDGRSLDNVPDNSAYFGATTSDRQLYVKCTAYTDATAFAEAFANASIVYPLDSSVEYTLTASQVNALVTSLKGVNNLYADSGDILSVEYSADTKLYVDGKISEGMKLIALLLTANHEDGMKASKAYASGDLLTVGNTLYKATTSIANGATLTAGTNVTETTIAQELAALA